jgi:hypothetical protein
MSFPRVRPGDPMRIPSRAWNAALDAAEAHQAVPIDLRRGRADELVHERLILVRNDTEEDLPRFGILGIGEPIIVPGDPGERHSDDFARRPAISGQAITEEAQYIGRFVVARGPIAVGAMGWAVIRGVTPAMVDIIDVDHTHADTFELSQYLQSGFTGGARILWKLPEDEEDEEDDGTGLRFCLLEVGPRDRDRFRAKLGTATLIGEQTWGWKYAWEEMRIDGDDESGTYGQYVVVADGLSSDSKDERLAFNSYESNPTSPHGIGLVQPIPAGTHVWMRAERTVLGDTRFVFDALPLSELFAVDVTQAGGVEGDGDTPCSFTYEIRDLAGNILANSVAVPLAPEKARTSVGKYVAGSGLGWARLNRTTGAITLWDANEAENVEVCDE